MAKISMILPCSGKPLILVAIWSLLSTFRKRWELGRSELWIRRAVVQYQTLEKWWN